MSKKVTQNKSKKVTQTKGAFMQYQTIWREKKKKFNTNKKDLMNQRGRMDIDLVDDNYYYTEDMDGFQLNESIHTALSTLSDREERIIKEYHGFVDNPMTFQEIATKDNLSSTRITDVYYRALRKLRHPLKSKRIKEFGGIL